MPYSKADKVLLNKQYGQWNAILAKYADKQYVFYQNQAKIFPEKLEDWISSIRTAYIHNSFIPIRLDIDITNSCSNNCIMCFAKELRENCNTMISLQKLEKIFANFSKSGGKSVRLTGGGDPLNHPQIIAIIQCLASLGLQITIETNGDRLSSQISDIIARYVNHLRISVDAGDHNSRLDVHRPHMDHFTYDNLLEKIKKIREISAKYDRGEELFLGATFIMLPENFTSVTNFMHDMYKAGVNWIALRKNVYREVYDKWPDIIPFVEQEAKKFREKIAKNNKDFVIEGQYGVSFNPENEFDTCWVSHARLIVLADSSLQLCCLARNGLIHEANIGELPNEARPIDSVIDNNSQRIQAFRETVPEKCPFCIDRDNNISFSNIHKILQKDKDAKFTKAYVYISDNGIITTDKQIVRIPVDKGQYKLFQQGKIMNI